jgi:hypothetical protein
METSRKKWTYFLSLAVVLSSACRQSTQTSVPAQTVEPGTLKILTFHSDSSIPYKKRVPFINNIAKNIGLPILSGGYLGSYMRIWGWDSSGKKWVVDLSRNHTDTVCDLLSYTMGTKDGNDYVYIHEQQRVVPRSGWIKFLRCIDSFNIPLLPPDRLPRERKQMTSISYVLFEIDQPNEYRFVEYPDPAYFAKEDLSCKVVAEFIEYFNSEMGTNICTMKNE